MFYYFFLQYKNEIYPSNKKKLKIKDMILLTILFTSSITFAVSSMIQILNITIISLVIYIAVITYMSLYIRKLEKSRVHEKVQNYKLTKINPLIKLLKSDTYNLYTLEGVNWLIECCITEPKKLEFRISFQSIVLPFITLAYTAIINNIIITEIVSISVIFIIVIILIIISGIAIQPFLDYIVSPDKAKYSQLKSELEYIKSQLKK